MVRRLAAVVLVPLALLVGPVAAAPAVATASAAQPASPGDPPLAGYPGLAPREAPRTFAVDTTPTPCANNGDDKTVTRSQVLTRARSWVTVVVPYSQLRCYRNSYGDYRTDCSGFISMAWGLGGSGSAFWTGNLMDRAFQISRSALKPGDALLRHTGDPSQNHVALFVQWADSARTQPVVMEQTGSADTIQRTWSESNASLYSPIRYDNIVDDPEPDPQASVVRSGDFTGDSRSDVAAQFADGELRAWRSTGDLTQDQLLAPGSGVRIGTGWTTSTVQRVVVGDFTGDGRDDIVGQFADGELRAWRSTGDLTQDQLLAPGSGVRIGTGWTTGNVQRILVGDFTGDGKDDLAGQFADGELRVWRSTGDLTQDQLLAPGSGVRIGTGWTTGNVRRVVVGDFTGDGKDDIVGQFADGELRAWRSTGDLTQDQLLAPGSGVRIGTGWTAGNVQRILVGDFTGDGKDDIVGQFADGELRAWRSTGDLTQDQLLSPGNGVRIGTGWTTSNVQRILVGDFTGDGKSDLAGQFADGELRAWRSTGDLTQDQLLAPGSGVRIGTGWTTGNVHRIL
ncbi:VCBS repeat-containing protein [Actinomycetes bacterium KLBMP 9797]